MKVNKDDMVELDVVPDMDSMGFVIFIVLFHFILLT
jgi:hypothetical protein